MIDWDEELTEKQKEKIKDVKDPTITDIINIAEEFNVDPLTVFKYFNELENK